LRERAYEPFIRLLRANMSQGGALRIDHVMALLRLWWVPRGRPSAEGSYVHYRLDDLMGIVALESQRNRCLVIGEDLGTVPKEIRKAMPEHGVYSYRVLFFERTADGRFLRPDEYPRDALVTVSTHDLPPFASYWAGSDITLRERLGLYSGEEQAADERRARMAACDALRAALEEAGLAALIEDTAPPVAAVLNFVARAPSAVLMLQPEDWLGMTTPVNVPGTDKYYPNWRRKLVAEWPEFMGRDATRQLAASVRRARDAGLDPGSFSYNQREE
jgi:4-alpha-glucanotransferase